MLPFMVLSIVAAGALFVTVSHRSFSPVRDCSDLQGFDLKPTFEQARGNLTPMLRFETRALLEARLIEYRNCQASYAVRSRMWIRYLAFVTGLALALIGATFILGQIRIRQSDVSAGGESFKASLQTSSPGVLLAAFGTALIIVALVVRSDVELSDGVVYLTDDSTGVQEATMRDIEPPAPWPAEGKK